jgi:hypothetical protein
LKITQVYMTLEEYSYEPLTRAKYQFLSNYLTLLISTWLKKIKLDLGAFNRIIFEEDASDDLSVVGDKAFVVSLKKEFKGLEQYSSAEVVHEYFVRKYLEGFERFDKKFNLDLTEQLRLQLEDSFKNNCFEYEAKAKSKKVGDITVQVIHRYRYDTYDLVVRMIKKNKEIVAERVIFTCDPDPFIVHFEVNKVEIEDDKIRIINKNEEQTLVADL